MVTKQRLFSSFALMTLLAVATNADPPRRYANAQYHYSFEIPAGWQNLQQKPPIVAFGTAPEQGFRTNINFYSEPVKTMSLEEYMKVSKKAVLQMKSIKIIETKSAKLGGEPAYQLRMHLTLPGKPAIENLQYICVHQNRAFVVTSTALSGNYAKALPVFDKAYKSFKWEK